MRPVDCQQTGTTSIHCCGQVLPAHRVVAWFCGNPGRDGLPYHAANTLPACLPSGLSAERHCDCRRRDRFSSNILSTSLFGATCRTLGGRAPGSLSLARLLLATSLVNLSCVILSLRASCSVIESPCALRAVKTYDTI